MDDKQETPTTQPVPTEEKVVQAPGKKKVKTKPDKYHAALKGKMASVGVYRRVFTV